MARPTLLDDALREELEATLAAGTPVRIAAESAGVSRSQLYEWLSRGLVERRPRLRLVEEESANSDAVVVDDPAEEDARIEAALVGACMKAASNGDWQAARWLLRNRWPHRGLRGGRTCAPGVGEGAGAGRRDHRADPRRPACL